MLTFFPFCSLFFCSPAQCLREKMFLSVLYRYTYFRTFFVALPSQISCCFFIILPFSVVSRSHGWFNNVLTFGVLGKSLFVESCSLKFFVVVIFMCVAPQNTQQKSCQASECKKKMTRQRLQN